MSMQFFLCKKTVRPTDYERRNTGLCKSILQAVLGTDTRKWSAWYSVL